MAAKVYSGRELSAFCLQISILLKAAVPLDEGLYLMAEDAPTEEEKKLLHTMGEDGKAGTAEWYPGPDDGVPGRLL